MQNTTNRHESVEAAAASAAGESTPKFKIGDRVKIPSKGLVIGTIRDIWKNIALGSTVYSVSTEDEGSCLYYEYQLEPAPLSVTYRFDIHLEDNVAVVAMIATQGEKSWCHARGHAHILYGGEIGIAQAVSYAAKRMFEALDTKNAHRIYFKPGTEDTSC